MNITNFCGFETNDASELTQALQGTCSIQGSTKYSGDYALRSNPTTTAIGYGSIPTTYDSAGVVVQNVSPSPSGTYVGFHFCPSTLPAANSEEIGGFYAKEMIRINSSGNLMLFQADGTTQVGSNGSISLTPGNWYWIELYCIIGNPGSFIVRVDGTQDIVGSYSTSGDLYWRFDCGKVTNRNGQSVDFAYDDVVFRTDDWPTEGSVARMDANGDGVYTAWTIGTGGGADWENVDDLVSNDGGTTHLLSTLVSGDASTVALESASSAGISGDVFAVKACAICARNGSGVRLHNVRFRSGSTDSDTTDVAAATAFTLYPKLFNTDPNTGTTWTLDALDSIEVGVVEKTTLVKTRCTALGAMVYYGLASIEAHNWGAIF